jgi:NodT family efflux transporter outer membrane factor (OMF) lipoprotein
MVQAIHTQANPQKAQKNLLSTVMTEYLLRCSQRTLFIAFSLALGGCVVGPDFKSPAAPQLSNNRYTASEVPAVTVEPIDLGRSVTAQKTVYGQDLPAQWWTLFRSAQLDQLIRSALTHNPSLAAAKASLRQAEENYNALSGSLKYPSVTGEVSARRESAARYSATPSILSLYDASVNVSYRLDLFGGNKRQLEGLMAGVDFQRFETEAAYQTLIANVVTSAITEASLRAELKATRDLMNAQQKQLDVMTKQLALGTITPTILYTQSNQVAQTRSVIAQLEKALELTRNRLSVYIGKLPSETSLAEFDLDSLVLPQTLPVSLPSSLVRQRPDIRASEALLHQASAQVGVDTANLYPQINLTGSYGVNRLKIGGFNASNTLWGLGAGLTQPILDIVALNAKRRAAVAAYDQADANYRSTVLNAFKDVADSLLAIDADTKSLQVQADTEVLAKAFVDLNAKQLDMGAVSYLTLLDAERTYQQTRINLVRAKAARFTNTALLFQALGGGWWSSTTGDAVSDHK